MGRVLGPLAFIPWRVPLTKSGWHSSSLSLVGPPKVAIVSREPPVNRSTLESGKLPVTPSEPCLVGISKSGDHFNGRKKTHTHTHATFLPTVDHRSSCPWTRRASSTSRTSSTCRPPRRPARCWGSSACPGARTSRRSGTSQENAKGRGDLCGSYLAV